MARIEVWALSIAEVSADCAAKISESVLARIIPCAVSTINCVKFLVEAASLNIVFVSADSAASVFAAILV